MPLFDPPPLPGDEVDSYKLVETLGIGGNATVYKATCPDHGHVAIKVLHPGKTTEEDLKRFDREYISLKRLDHPNIVRVYRSGAHKDYPWLSIEFVDGTDLSEQIKKWNQMSSTVKFPEIRKTLLQICQALEYIHQQGMIHRDLKPSNVLITQDGTPKITDFGGVKAPATFQSELTTMGRLVGTVAFMAPEHILGEKIDKRADLYSLGAVLYMCLTGKKPFEAQNIAGYLSLHLTTPPPNPQDISPEIPRDLSEICLKLMQKDRENRFQSAQEIISSLSKKSRLFDNVVGIDEEREQIASCLHSFLEGQSVLMCLYGYRGTGKNTLIKSVIRQLKEQNIAVSIDDLTNNTSKKAIIIDSLSPSPKDFEHLRNQLAEGHIILVLLTSSSKTIFYEEALGMPCETIYIRPLNLPETQTLLSTFNIKGKGNSILSHRLQIFFKGRQEYIYECLAFLQQKSEKKIGILEAKNLKIPIPNSVRKIKISLLSRLSPNSRQILECLLVHHNPISETALLHLCQQTKEDFREALFLLQSQHWITQHLEREEPIITLAEHHLEAVLYELIKKERRISWHKRIASILSRQRRQNNTEKTILAHHLERSEHYSKSVKKLLSAAKGLSRDQNWITFKEVILKAETLSKTSNCLLDNDDKFLLYSLLESLTTHQGNTSLAFEYNHKALQLPLSPHQIATLEIRSSLLRYNPIYCQRSLALLSPQDPLWVQGTKDAALHDFLAGRLDAAQQYWNQLSQHSSPQAQNVGRAGSLLLEALHAPRDAFLEYLQKHHQTLPNHWSIWLIENYICIGKWTQALRLAQDVSERLINNPVLNTRTLALEGFLLALMGKPPQAHQALSVIKSMLLSPFDVSSTRSIIHVARLELTLGKELSSYSFSWNNIPVHLDDLRTQWLVLLNRHRQQPPAELPTVQIPWTQDIVLYDVAQSIRVAISPEVMENIWQAISPKCFAVQLLVAHHFFGITNKKIWKTRGQKSLEYCKTHHGDSFYDFHNWLL